MADELDQIFDAARPCVEAAAAPQPGDDALQARIVGESLRQWEMGAVAVAATLTASKAATAGKAATAATATKAATGMGIAAKVVLASVMLTGGGAVAVSLATSDPAEPTPAVTEAPAVRASATQRKPSTPPPAEATPAVEASIEPEPAPVEAIEDEEPELLPAPAPSKPLSASKMLERANHSRNTGAPSAAVRQYRAILRDHPTSREATVARISAAEVLLKRLHKPGAARKLYRAYLRHDPRGNLAEEALWGSARASRALNDAAGERKALTKLLAQYPSSVRAGPSRSRLQALDASE